MKRSIRPFIAVVGLMFLSACAHSNSAQDSGAQEQRTPSYIPSESAQSKTHAPDQEVEESEPEEVGEESRPSSADLDSEESSELEFSGDYKEDLRNIGFEVPDEEGYELLVERYEGQYCDPPVSDDSDWLHFQLSLFNELEQGNEDIVRVVVNYECKHRMDLIEEVFADAPDQ